MRAHSVPSHIPIDLRSQAGRALVKSALWMIVGYIGASALTIGLLSLFHGKGSLLSALAVMLGGGWLAAYAWHSSYRILDRMEAPDEPAPDQARAAARSTSGLTTLIGAPEA
jgi:hypothetical protein